MNILKHFLFLLICISSTLASDTDDSTKVITSNTDSTGSGTIIGTVTSRGVKDSKNVIVYLEHVKGNFKVDSIKPNLDQINRVFIPHVLPIMAGTTVRFVNSDSLDHNIFSPSVAKPFNIGTWGYGGTRDIKFDDTGVISLLCNIHSEMSAFIVILQNPFYAQTGLDGKYSIKEIPPGKYVLKIWHEKLKSEANVVLITAGDTVKIDYQLSP